MLSDDYNRLLLAMTGQAPSVHVRKLTSAKNSHQMKDNRLSTSYPTHSVSVYYYLSTKKANMQK